MFEKFDHANKLYAKAIGDAPKTLRATLQLAHRALKRNQLGVALTELRAAQKIIDQEDLSLTWQAELHVGWAFYHLQQHQKEKARQEFIKASRCEPDNPLITELKQALLANQ